MSSESQKQIFREILAKKMRLKHFFRPKPHFLGSFQKKISINRFWIDTHCAKKSAS